MIETYKFKYWYTLSGGQYKIIMNEHPGEKPSFFLDYKDKESQLVVLFFSLAEAKELYYALEAMLAESRGIGWQRREPHG